MRGLAVVALGAVLIWFGLGQGDSSSGTVQAAEGEGAEAADAEETADSGGARLGSRASGGADPEAPSKPVASPSAGPPRADDRPAAPEVLVQGDWPGGLEAQPAPERFEPRPAREESAPAAPSDEPPRPATDSVVGFDSVGPGTGTLGRLLLEAWLNGDPGDLQTYVQVGEGADLPRSQRELVVAFWMALGTQVDDARREFDRLRGQDGVTSAQLALLGAALDPPGSRGVPRAASSARPEALAHAMGMILLNDEAESLLEVREYGRSAVAWSELIQLEVAAPWDPHRGALLAWAERLEQAQGNHRLSPRGEWPSFEVKVESGDSLVAIRKRVLRSRPDLLICTGLIEAANKVRGYLQPGDVLRIPTERANVLVDLDARLVMYRHGNEVVRAWECGIGKPGHETPIGVYTVGTKQPKPAHTTKGLPYGHPDNPLGSHWLGLHLDGRNTSYGIHGTSDPDGVGGEVSLGCIRMRNEDVGELFELLPRGATVVLQR